VVDLGAPDPRADLHTVRRELAAYDPAIAGRPFLIVGTKVDLLHDDKRASLQEDLQGEGDVVLVSGMTGEGIEALADRLHDLARRAEEDAPAREPYVVLRPGRERFVVRREGERFRVIGRDVERWVADVDLDDARAVVGLQKRLAKAGVEQQLAAAGARRGDEVVIGDRAFEFYPEEQPEEPQGEP
jgi:GTP-binding protein